jgi:hypothetical protein
MRWAGQPRARGWGRLRYQPHVTPSGNVRTRYGWVQIFLLSRCFSR